MFDDIRQTFETLKEEVVQLHFRWIIYRQLFASSPKDLELLNASGSNVFFLLQRLLLDDVALTLSKLTDPSEQGNKQNLSIARLVEAIKPRQDVAMCDELDRLSRQLASACGKFRLLRNKRIAHADYRHALKIEAEPLPGVSRSDVEEALLGLREVLNHIQGHCFGGETAYDMLITDLKSDGTALLKRLRASDSEARRRL